MASHDRLALAVLIALAILSSPLTAQFAAAKKARKRSDAAPTAEATAPAPARTQGQTGAFAWADQAQHPMRALVEAAPLLTREVANDFKLAKLSSPSFATLLNQPAFAKYAQTYRAAKDEFARRRLEVSILAELKASQKQLMAPKYYKVYLEAGLAEYSFRDKTFGFRPTGSPIYGNDHLELQDRRFWRVLFPTLVVPEAAAEAFVQGNPRRNVTLVVLLETTSFQINDQVARLNERIRAKAVFSAAFSNAGDGTRTLLAVQPNATALPGQFKASAESILADLEAQRRPAAPGQEPRQDKDCLEGNHVNLTEEWNEALNLAGELGFNLGGDASLQATQAKLVKVTAERFQAIAALLKVGQPIQGIQTYPNGTKKPVVLRFTKKGTENSQWEGTLTYANKKKAIVLASPRSCVHGPCLNLDFYSPQDDEIGAGNGTTFHVAGHQAMGKAMTDAVVYQVEAPVTFTFK